MRSLIEELKESARPRATKANAIKLVKDRVKKHGWFSADKKGGLTFVEISSGAAWGKDYSLVGGDFRDFGSLDDLVKRFVQLVTPKMVMIAAEEGPNGTGEQW